MPDPIQVVIDTNVVVAALRSKTGASHALLDQIGRTTRWQLNLSSALFLEYEEQAKRIAPALNQSLPEIDRFLDRLATESRKWMLSRERCPISRDPDDDMLLDLAIQAKAAYIITFNTRNFVGAERQGIQIVKPGGFLQLIQRYERY